MSDPIRATDPRIAALPEWLRLQGSFTPSWQRKAYCGMCSVEWPQRYLSFPGCDCGKLNRREAADAR